MKVFRKIAILMVMCFALFTAVAFTPLMYVIMNENLKISFNSKLFQFKDENGLNLMPLTYNNRNYLPVRAILEKVGVFVDYDEVNQTIILKSENTLLNRADLALHYLKYKDLEQLAMLVHPTKGITFSPYCYVSDMDLNFSAKDIKNLSIDQPYIWGEYDGSGHPISLNFSEFNSKFIYTADFINAETIGNNKIIQTGGNTTNNIEEVYPEARFIEYNFSGFDKEVEGLDWESLRLVFEDVNNEWYLVGVIHDSYSI